MTNGHGAQYPVGWGLVIGGGALAQISPTTGVGAAGLIASLSGLLLAAFQYYKVWMDARQRDQKIEEQNHQIDYLKRGLVAAADKRHQMRNDFNGVLTSVQAELMEANLRVARLEGQLGVTAKTHAKAINTISDTVAEVAERVVPPVDVPHPHLPVNGEKPDVPAKEAS